MNSSIAITAMAGLLPGPEGTVTAEGYWRNVRQARTARLQCLESKWKIPRSAYFDPNPGVPYRTYMDSAYTITGEDGTDQVELGKKVLGDLRGSILHTQLPDPRRTGLCVATLWTDSSYFIADSRRVFGELSLGVGGATGQIYGPDRQLAALAEAADLRGPAVAVDTACASSLYAFDAAIGMIETGSADAVVVLGLNAFLPSFLYFGFSKLTALSPKNEIAPFSAHASGIIPSEAIAAVLVEPLDRALAAGRSVLGVVRGLGLSADGGDRSVFAPSAKGQQLAYERAYRHVDPASVDYVEAHGTATVLGDHTEVETLDTFFLPSHRETKLPIGSAKALIGHTLASAGIVSLIKVLCMIRDRIIPPHIPVEPHPLLQKTCLRLPAAAENWPAAAGRNAAVSSFGFGGSNAHMILGPLEASDTQQARKAPFTFAPVAIVQAEATMGKSHGLAAIQEGLSGKPCTAEFSYERFYSQPSHTEDAPVRGSFFPDQLAIESNGLRMGPKPLAKLDPLQRLAIHSVQRVLEEEGAKRDPDNTAVVVCANLGGETGLQLSRHYLSHFNGRTDGPVRCRSLEPCLEVIASGLPSLASGFPAFHFGLKGFHEVLSGESGTFWQALSLAPYWLSERCSKLVLAGGRFIKSPVDLDGGAACPGEGVAAFLLAREHNASNSLGVIRAFVPFSEDVSDSLVSACAHAGLEVPAFDLVEISQLRPDDPAAVVGEAQKVYGSLAEATGAEALLRVLLLPGLGWRAIEIRTGERKLGWIVLEKTREVVPKQFTPVKPLEVEFQTGSGSFPARQQPLPAVEVVQPGSVLETFLAWQRETEGAVVSFLKAQRDLANFLTTNGTVSVSQASYPVRPPRSLRSDPKNIVIRPPLLHHDEGVLRSASTRLEVDESHSYFFDHPLDHLPGILIMEGILQLIETLMPEGHFISSLSLSFKKFCEKNIATVITTHPRTTAGQSIYSVEVSQGGAEVAQCELATQVLPVDKAPGKRAPVRDPHPNRRTPDPKYIHKLHKENVLVTELEAIVPGQRYRCDLLPAPANHVLSEGNTDSYSLLYLLETARQFVMLVAHTVEQMPLTGAMNLLSIQVTIEEPVPRHDNLWFLCTRRPVQRLGSMTLAEIGMELHGSAGKLGVIAIKAQAVDQQTYLKQRGLEPETRGRA